MKFRRFTAILLSVLMIAGLIPVSAYAAERTQYGMINELEEGDSSYISQNEEVLEYVYDEIMAHSESIDLYSYKIPSSDAKKLFLAIIGVYPEIFFVKRGYSYSTRGGYLAALKPSYLNTKEEADAMLEEFYAKADWYLDMLDDSMDDFTKALVLHDQLAINNYYQITADDGTESTNYTFMVQGWGRCENYAEVYAYLLAQEGIKSEIINSENMVHEWMKIKLDGSEYYYNIDLTWDDPQTQNGDRPGKASHTYFLLSDEEFQQADSSADREAHYDYEYINESDDAYDSYDNLHSLDNPMYYIDGALYTLYTRDSKGYVAAYDHADDSFTDKVAIEDIWYYYGNKYSYWPGNFSGIGEYEDLIYYSGENCVYVYDPHTDRSFKYIDEALTDGNQLYGLYIKDGYIIGLSAPSPNDSATDVELGKCLERYEITAESSARGTIAADAQYAYTGDTVTLTVTPNTGYTVRSVSYNGAEITGSDGIYTFTMPEENVTVSAEFGFEDSVEAKLAGNTISIEGDIGVNFYMDLGDELLARGDEAFIRFTYTKDDDIHVEDIPVNDAVKKGGYYIFKCNVAAKAMTTEISAQIIDGDNEGSVYTYTVKQYADYILANAYDENGEVKVKSYADAAELVKAMLNYGAYSQIEFNDTHEPANSGLSEEDRQLADITADDLSDYSSYTTSLGDGVKFEGASLSLQSETTLSLFFTSDSTLTYSYGGTTAQTKVYGKYQIARIRGIRSRYLGESFTVTVYDGEDEAGTVSFSPMKYCYNVLAGSSYDADLKNVVKALYTYYKAAYEYFKDK